MCSKGCSVWLRGSLVAGVLALGLWASRRCLDRLAQSDLDAAAAAGAPAEPAAPKAAPGGTDAAAERPRS